MEDYDDFGASLKYAESGDVIHIAAFSATVPVPSPSETKMPYIAACQEYKPESESNS